MAELIIYDFDGVIADSETVSNLVLAEMLTEAGLPTTYEDALKDYCGWRWKDCAARAEAKLGRTLPADFGKRREAEVLRRLTRELEAVPGAQAFIDAFAGVERCIGSSSAPGYLNLCLAKLGLADRFDPTRIFSAAVHVERGKPHPDLFLYAATRLKTRPEACLVIEDSPHGVEAGVAAGMIVVGLCAGSHVRDGHDKRLRAAGAHHVVHTFREAERLVRVLA